MNRLILSDFIAYLPARVIPALVALGGIPIVTRLLSPADYGTYLLAVTTLTLIGSFSTTWLVSIVVRFRPTLDGKLLTRLVRPFLAGSGVVGVALWLAVTAIYGAPLAGRWLIPAGCAWLVSFGLAEYVGACLRADERAIDYSLVVSLRSIGGMAAAIALAWLVQPSAAMILLGTAIAAIAVLVPIRSRRSIAAPADAAIAPAALDRGTLLRYGVPIALSNLFVSGLSVANRYLIELGLGVRQVAIYGASYDIAEKSIFFLNAMLLLSSSVMAIKIFEREGEAVAASFLSGLIRFYLLIACLMVSGIAALSDDLVAVLLPADYRAGAAVLPIVTVAAMFVGVMHRYSLVLSFYKRSDIIMGCTLAALAINLTVCWFALPYWGILSGAIGCFCGYAAWLALIRLAVRRYVVPIFPWRAAARIALASGGCVLASRFGADLATGPARLVLGGFAGGLAYLFLLVLTGELSRTTLAQLTRARPPETA